MIYIWTCHFENSWVFILINMGFQKSCKTFDGIREFYFQIQNHKNKVMLLLRIEKKNIHIMTRFVEECSGFITLTY
jgi:hypothetical protein